MFYQHRYYSHESRYLLNAAALYWVLSGSHVSIVAASVGYLM